MLTHPSHQKQSGDAALAESASFSGCAHHCKLWLATSGMPYGPTAREQFARAHSVLFGRAYEVTLRGYERWRRKQRIADTVEAFAWYLSPRHERWLGSVGYGAKLAPCLVGDDTGQPCWRARADGP
jgi:hypothetical protein